MKIDKYESYYPFDLPIPYKNLNFHPISVEHYIDFHNAVNCLLIDKDSIPDPKIISMSYLDFLFWYSNQSKDNKIYISLLAELLHMCLQIDYEKIRYVYNEKGKVVLILNDEEYSKDDFKVFKEIICKQNSIDLDEDDDMHPDLKKALKEAQEYRNRIKNKNKICSFEDQVVCVMIALHEVDVDKIKNISIRKFAKIIQRYDYKLQYEILKTSEMSGFIKFKEEIDHWMSDLSQQNKYKDVMMDYDEFKSKFEK